VNRLKTALRIGGVLVFAIGLMCLPIGYGISPKRDLSPFNNLADLGAFIQTGLILIAVGLLLIGASYAVPGEMTD
jgi:hypothetical protein